MDISWQAKTSIIYQEQEGKKEKEDRISRCVAEKENVRSIVEVSSGNGTGPS